MIPPTSLAAAIELLPPEIRAHPGSRAFRTAVHEAFPASRAISRRQFVDDAHAILGDL